MSNKLFYGLAFLALVITVAISVTTIQERKQEAIRYQADLEYKAALEAQRLTEIIEEMRLEEVQRQRNNLFECLDKAEKAYINYAELNGSVDENGIIQARPFVWEKARENRNYDEEKCYKLFN